MPKFLGRKKPYKTAGINRVPCARCSQPSVYQWSTCANNHRYLGFCEDCDVAMNAMVLAFIGTEHAADLMKWYMEQIDYDGSHPAFAVHVPAQIGPRADVDRPDVGDRDDSAVEHSMGAIRRARSA